MPKRSPRMVMKTTTRTYLKYVYIILGWFMAVLGVFCTFFSRMSVDRLIESKMILSPGSDIVKMWQRPDVNISLDFYFFNWTNPKDFYNMRVKPKLEEIGPYSYTQVATKKIFQWHPENNTMDYGKTDFFYFNEKRSKRKLDDVLVTVNTLLVAAAAKSQKWSYVKQTVIDMALKFYKNGVVWKRTADEFFFKGFNDDILNLLSVLPASFRSSLSLLIPWDRIGYTYARNGSTEYLGKHTIHTGAGDIDQLGQIVLYKDKNYTDAFPKECHDVKGSPGEFQKAHLKKNESILYFFSDFCRSVEMDYLDEVTVEGILGYRYIFSPKTFDNGTSYPESKCFCADRCVPFGAFSIENCWYGLPMYVSEPHFLHADDYHLNEVEGMKPNKSMHETTIVLEPKTGFMLELNGKLQVNIYIQPTYHISAFPSRRRVVFPVMWFDMHIRASKKSAKLLSLIINMTMYCHIVGAVSLVLATLLLLWQPCKRQWNKRYAHHMEINALAYDEYDNDDIDAAKDIASRDKIFGMPSNFPSLRYITHPRRSLPIIINPVDGDDEALSSCLEDDRRQQFEMSSDECDTRLGDS